MFLNQLANNEWDAIRWAIVFQVKLIPLSRVSQVLQGVSLKLTPAHEKRPADERVDQLHEPRRYAAFSSPWVGHVLTDYHSAARLQKAVKTLDGLRWMGNTAENTSTAD